MINWLAVMVLGQMDQLEQWAGDVDCARRWRSAAARIARAADTAFWDERRGLYRDDRSGRYLSEHTQCLAVLSGRAPRAHAQRALAALVTRTDLTRTTIYFSHYLFDTLYRANRIDVVQSRLEEWYGLAANGMRTTRENPEPTRSDCHAWGAHPLYHYYASFAGIRPAAPGFERVAIEPRMGTLTTLKASVPTPRGTVRVELSRVGARGVEGTISLPRSSSGTFTWNGAVSRLRGGANRVRVSDRATRDRGSR